MDKNKNRSTITHTIRAKGYKYDVLKGELSQGSFISKLPHPIPEVEKFKKKLSARKILKDMGTHWVLKKNVRTGHLMALNLHFGYLVKESPYKQDVVVTADEAAKLENQLPEKHICVTTSEIVMKSICDTLRLSSVNFMEVNEDIFVHHGSDTFGQEEKFVLNILQKMGVVSSSVRHGSTSNNEADIIDEIKNEQYEVTYEFKTDLPKKLMKPDILYSPEILALQLVDSPFIHTSKSLEKKLKKEYSKQYRSNLVVLTLGSKDSIVSMLEALSKKLEKEQITKLYYSNFYIISLDFINEQALYARISPTEPFVSKSFPCKNDELGFIKLTPVDFVNIEDSHKYLMICESVFDGTQRLRYDDGKSLKTWAKEIRIWDI